jgi:hypothetical protein
MDAIAPESLRTCGVFVTFDGGRGHICGSYPGVWRAALTNLKYYHKTKLISQQDLVDCALFCPLRSPMAPLMVRPPLLGQEARINR